MCHIYSYWSVCAWSRCAAIFSLQFVLNWLQPRWHAKELLSRLKPKMRWCRRLCDNLVWPAFLGTAPGGASTGHVCLCRNTLLFFLRVIIHPSQSFSVLPLSAFVSLASYNRTLVPPKVKRLSSDDAILESHNCTNKARNLLSGSTIDLNL